MPTAVWAVISRRHCEGRGRGGRRRAAGRLAAQRKDAIAAAGGRAQPIALDVTDPASVASAFDEASSALGPITVVVNNAGIAITKPLLEHTEDDWLQVIEVNLNGAWRVAQAAARHMVKHEQGGSIVNVASILGLQGVCAGAELCRVQGGAHPAHQGDGTRTCSLSHSSERLAPGYVETGINREFFESDAGKALIKRVPQRRIGQPGELDGALLSAGVGCRVLYDRRSFGGGRRPRGEHPMTKPTGRRHAGRLRFLARADTAVLRLVRRKIPGGKRRAQSPPNLTYPADQVARAAAMTQEALQGFAQA